MNSYIVKRPVITEKSIEMANTQNVYTFVVARSASKNQVRQAVEELFGVKVIDLNTVSKPRTQKKTGRKRAVVSVPPTKKALVKLKEGQTIALFDLGGND